MLSKKIKMYKKLFIIIFLQIFFTPLFALSLAEKADSAYLAGNFSEAIGIYQEIAEHEGTSAPLLYNLGNAYLQDGDYGYAMLCYQRAKKLDPSNKQIAANLNYLSEKVEDANKAEQRGKRRKVSIDTPNFFQTVHASIAEEHSSNMWAGWAAAFFLIFSGCVALYLFTSNVLLRKSGFFGGFIFLGLSMIFIVCAYSAANASEKNDFGIIVAYKTQLETEPNSRNDEKNSEGVLTRGTKVRIVSEESDAEGNVSWYKVRLNSDYIGWIPSEDMEVI